MICAMGVIWMMGPLHTLPFYVSELAKKNVRAPEKLAWIRQEPGDDEDICQFSQKYLDVFGDKVLCGDVPPEGRVPQSLLAVRKSEEFWKPNTIFYLVLSWEIIVLLY